MEKLEEKQVRQRLNTLRLVALGIMIGPVVFLFVLIYLRHSGRANDIGEMLGILQNIAIAFVVLVMAVSIAIRLCLAKILASAETLLKATERYFVTVIVSLAICEAPMTFCAVLILLGADTTLMVALFVTAFVGQLIHFPSRQRLIDCYEQGQVM